jgi:hypothetical protein
MTTIKPFQDYDDDDPDLNRRVNRWKFWVNLKMIRLEYIQKHGQFDIEKFDQFIQETYGLRLLTVDGNITDGFDIIDEKLYTIYLLKYGS